VSGYLGASTPRCEDDRLLRGKAKFVDDLKIPGLLEAAFVRSPLAHARIRSIDVSQAKALAGVRAVYLYADLRPILTCDRVPAAVPTKTIRFDVDPCVLAQEEVCYVGEPIALIVADDRRIAEDAAALVAIDFEPLPVVVDLQEAVKKGAARARLDCPDNIVARWTVGYGDAQAKLAAAHHRVSKRFRLHKGGAHSMETRGLIASWNEDAEALTVWNSTQMPHRVKNMLVQALGMADSRIRVVAPDVGGGFGAKGKLYPEELALPAAAILLGKPIKWIEDRLESFVSTNPERDQDWSVEAGVDADGRLLAISGVLLHDHGAVTTAGVSLPENSCTNLLGPYVLPAYSIDIVVCLTNMTSTTATRGAGRPQGTFVMERLLDQIAFDLGLTREEVRSRNLIQPHQMPYVTPIKTRDGLPMTYDSGDYVESQRMALAQSGWADFSARREEARKQGRWLGVGLCNYVEGTGRGPFESVTLRIGSSGKIFVGSGATAQGQGTRTMLAQIVAQSLAVPPEQVIVSCGDTAESPMGLGSYASRQTVNAGNAAHQAAAVVAQKLRAAAAAMMEADPQDVRLEGGFAFVDGAPGLKKSYMEIAKALNGLPGFRLPDGIEPGLSATVDFQPPAITYTNGSHVAEVEVDPLTGAVKILRYVVVHDCGNMINPMMVEGQVRGGVIHGVGMTLFEWMKYDEDGQPRTVSFADYLLPTADVSPNIEIHHMCSPTPLNPLGVKGAAESGVIGAPAAIVSAIEDALRPLPLSIASLPVTPARLVEWIQESAQRART
jgi:carbon-monoxide dehydrogenase large subunit